MSLKYYDTSLLTNIANAIRQQEGTNNLMTVEAMPNHINNIETGGSFKWMTFEGYTGAAINEEDIDFDINKAYVNMEGRLFCYCGKLTNIPNSINIFNFRNLDYAFYGCELLNIYDITGTYPYLETARDFYKATLYNKNYYRDNSGKYNIVFNLPNAVDLTRFLHLKNVQLMNGWTIEINAPNARIYDGSIVLNSSFHYTNYSNPNWNLNLYMPNLTKLSNFFGGNGLTIFNNASYRSCTKLYNLLNNISKNVTDASYMFYGFSAGNNGYLPNINTSKFEDVSHFLEAVTLNASNYTKYSTNLAKMDFSNVIYADYFFGNLTSNIWVDTVALDINFPNAISAKGLFGAAWDGSISSTSAYRYLDRNIDLPKCKDLSYMFSVIRNLNDLPVPNAPVVEAVDYYAYGCYNLKNVPENFLPNTVINLKGMFCYCNNLTNESLVNIAKWLLTLNTENIVDFSVSSTSGMRFLGSTYWTVNYNSWTGISERRGETIFYSCNKRINVATVGSDLVNQLTEAGWIIE